MNLVYVGLDFGSSSFPQAVLNQQGAKTVNRSFPTSEANLRAATICRPLQRQADDHRPRLRA